MKHRLQSSAQLPYTAASQVLACRGQEQGTYTLGRESSGDFLYSGHMDGDRAVEEK